MHNGGQLYKCFRKIKKNEDHTHKKTKLLDLATRKLWRFGKNNFSIMMLFIDYKEVDVGKGL